MSLIDALSTTEPLTEIFSDAAVLRAMLDFEVALARVQARAGMIPAGAASAIADAARVDGFDPRVIAEDARRSATPAISFVAALRERVRATDAGSAAFVHWGATSQDVTDTALVLLLARARPVLAADVNRVAIALRRLSDDHASTVMLGRTLMQPATPITFGLKSARWHAAVVEDWRRLDTALDRCGAVQLGGAAGTLAPFGDRGLAIARALAEELKLRPSPPWHTDRGRIAAVVSACAILGAALAKVARDIVLLMQPEVGEVAAPGGGSSTMPHKQNPSGCAVVLAAAARLPGLASASLAAMANEHERGVGGVQAEWPIVVTAVQAAGAALAAMAGTIEGVKPDPDRMRANLAATRGTVFAERATLLLRRSLGDERAAAIVAAALDRCRRDGVSFAAALGAVPEAARALGADLDTIDRPEDYLGAADAIRRELLTD